MAWHNVDIEGALRRLADRRVEEAMAEGKFDNLPGAGKPLDLEPMPADEKARLMWWALRIMKNNDVTPDEVVYRKQIDVLLERIEALTDEAALPALVTRANEFVRKINTNGHDGPEGVRRAARPGQRAAAAPPATGAGLTVDADAVKRKAISLGFDLVGIAATGPSRHADYLRRWLDAGRHGEMAYLADRFAERADPSVYFPGVRSAVCVAAVYRTPLEQAREGQQGRIARYALGVDYHDHIKPRLYDLADWLRAETGCDTRCGVDTVPVMEKELAARAGLGWMGKNTCVIHPLAGSFLLLGEVLTTLDLPADDPAVDRCGSCTRCLDACPTGAITDAYQLDATRCISYLTIEHRGAIAADLQRQMGDWIYGCDVCQDVCPWNRRETTTDDPAFAPRWPSGTVPLDEVAGWSTDDYHRATRRSVLRRVKLPVLQRNAANARRNAAV